MLLRRHILLPSLLAALVMFLLSWVWHGLALRDLQELTIPEPLYHSLAGLIYVVIGFGLTIGTHTAIQHQFISLKTGFPLSAMMIGAAVGFFVYLVIFVLGVSFAKGGAVHMIVDVLWQMVEQGVGGLMVSLGIIYDMRQQYLEAERAH